VECAAAARNRPRCRARARGRASARGHFARRDVVTCRRHARIGEVCERVERSSYGQAPTNAVITLYRARTTRTVCELAFCGCRAGSGAWLFDCCT
jgi:hypothetical protein